MANSERELNLLTGATALNGAPSPITSATAGVARPFAMDQGVVLVHSTAGSGTLTAQVRIWGYQTNLGRWYDLGIINDGADVVEVGADTLSHAEGIAGLRAFDRFYAEVVAIGGTSTAINVNLVCVRSGPVTVS